VSLVHQQFRRGATELRSDSGSVTRELSVRRSDLMSATSLVRRAGLGFTFSFPAAPQVETPAPKAEREKPPK
jgi:hypothetical protein